MSWPAGEQRSLNQIEKTLADDHPNLLPLFAIFTRPVGFEAMPATERITARQPRAHRWARFSVVARVDIRVRCLSASSAQSWVST
jgi:hypothetical protein